MQCHASEQSARTNETATDNVSYEFLLTHVRPPLELHANCAPNSKGWREAPHNNDRRLYRLHIVATNADRLLRFAATPASHRRKTTMSSSTTLDPEQALANYTRECMPPPPPKEESDITEVHRRSLPCPTRCARTGRFRRPSRHGGLSQGSRCLPTH